MRALRSPGRAAGAGRRAPALSQTAKGAYVRVLRVLAWPLRRSGLMHRLERPGAGRGRRWLRSLFAIHDIDDMIRLDLAWWTFEALARVERFLAERPGARVFEYGSGASTLWLARRAGHVTSIEHDAGWYALVAARLAGDAPVTLVLRAPEAGGPAGIYRSAKPGWERAGFRAYASEIDRHDAPFDLVVIDGRARAACLAHAVGRLAPGGMIVFDNSGRRRYRDAIADAIAGAGLALERTSGLTPGLPYPEETTLMRRRPDAG